MNSNPFGLIAITLVVGVIVGYGITVLQAEDVIEEKVQRLSLTVWSICLCLCVGGLTYVLATIG
jgi:uncharacterized membrane-anchored protein YhcB (DUF1043 family)